MARSVSVTNTVLYPYENIMVIVRKYTYQKKYDAARQRVTIPKCVRTGWKYIGTEKDDPIIVGTTSVWTVREIYIQEKHIFNLPK